MAHDFPEIIMKLNVVPSLVYTFANDHLDIKSAPHINIKGDIICLYGNMWDYIDYMVNQGVIPQLLSILECKDIPNDVINVSLSCIDAIYKNNRYRKLIDLSKIMPLTKHADSEISQCAKSIVSMPSIVITPSMSDS